MEYSLYQPRQSVTSSWLNEPVVASNQSVTQINLIERITISKPSQSTAERSRSSSSSDGRRRRRSSSEERHRRRIRPLVDYDERQASDDRRSRSSSEERRRGRSVSRERRKERTEDRHRNQSNSVGHREDMEAVTSQNFGNGNISRGQRSSKETIHHGGSEESHNYCMPSTERTHYGGSEFSYKDRKSSTMTTHESEQSYKEHIKSPTKETHTVGVHTDQSTLQNIFTYDGKLRLQDGSLPKGTSVDHSQTQQIDKKTEDIVTQQDAERKVIYTEVSHKDYAGPERENQPLDHRLSTISTEGAGYHELHHHALHDDYKPSAACLTPSSLIFTISVTIACFWCFPVGCYAIYRACQIRRRVEAGDYEGAIKASKAAGFWGTLVLVWGALVLGLTILLLFVFTGHF